ncbi:MAG: UDP-glucose/GDP-mannose dehydrogenase family protein [Actinomycetales bacterium]|nr:UDP-glucose/GDP-mannose dehydrogenase family protein [Actinomycetales bacterium]
MTKLSVIGTGYLGVTHAACMASLGHQVIALDVDPAKIESLTAGVVPFHEPELQELLTSALESGNLTFTTDWSAVAQNADVHFLCVGTPKSKDSDAADLSQVNGAIASLAPHLNSPTLVVGKSTVPVGTAARLADYLKENSPAGNEVHLAWNPEFLREGFAVQDTLHPDRIVIGITNERDEVSLREVYAASIAEGTPFITTDYATAELVKVAANSFLATKISFINAFADLCDAAGADITQLADAIGHDTRIGRRFLNAGVGFGGGCLPKDIKALHARAIELGLSEQFEFLANVGNINQMRRDLVVARAAQAAGGSLSGVKITILGAAFKPDSDDIRDSPALSVARALVDQGAKVTIHDPIALAVVRRVHPDLHTEDDFTVAVSGAELLIHLTEWKEYRELDPGLVAQSVAEKVIIDGRNMLNRQKWASAGWNISYLGKPGA